MRINNNMAAVITNNQLLGNEQSLSDVMEKLSSGLSINHASDSPSGIAIAGKMQAQIDGLNQASRNSDDGISVLQTAEGALSEVTDMIQRMRELSVQAANGTNSSEERKSIQMEIDSLLEEIDRISATTEFNTINLLDGSLDNRTYAEHCARIQTSDTVAPGNYKLTIDVAATSANITQTGSAADAFTITKKDLVKNTETNTDVTFPASTGNNFIDYIDGQTYKSTTIKTNKDLTTETTYNPKDGSTGTGLAVAGTISVNGFEMTFEQGQSGESVYESLRIACEYGSAKISNPTELLSISSYKFGCNAELDIAFSSVDFARALGFNVADLDTDADGNTIASKSAVGTDAEVTLVKKYEVDALGNYVLDNGNKIETGSEFGMQSTLSYDGNKITISDTNGFEVSFLAEEDYVGNIDFNVTDIGSMTLQVGANEGQNIEIRIRSTSTSYMYIDQVDVTKMKGPEDAIERLDGALSYITNIRSQLGAYENRLDHTTKSLDATSENMTAAISRIEDADMATTMVEYTRLNVLEQASTSALAQANELPQLALQLLQ